MSFFSRLLKSKKPAKPAAPNKKAKAQQRATALSELSTETLIEAIENQSQTIDWQLSAIARLPYEDYLLGLITRKKSAKIYQAAVLRVASLMDEGVVTAEQLAADLPAPLLHTGVASFCSDTQILQCFIAQIAEAATLATLASESPTAKVRLAAANKLQDIDIIKPLIRKLKHKDKTVHRVLKDKLDTARTWEKGQADIENQLLRICEALASLAHKYAEPTFAGQLQRMERKWGECVTDNTRAELHEQYQQALAACRAPGEKAAREKQLQEEQAQRNKEAAEAYDTILNNLGEFAGTLFSAENLEESTVVAQRLMAQQKDAWGEVGVIASATEVQNKALANIEQATGNIITLMAESGSLAQNLEKLNEKINPDEKHIIIVVLKKYLQYVDTLPASALSPIVLEAKALLAKIQQEKRESVAIEKEHSQVVESLIRKGNAAIGRGSLRQACGIRNSIAEKILEDEVLSTRLSRQLDDLDKSIEKFQGYRDFSVEPKKQALIASMQVLSEKSTGANVDAENLANQIQKLQGDWKELVYGGKDMQPELWEEFHGLSRIAYKPCEVYFLARADERKANLVLREALLNSFEDYLKDYSWEAANWKDVEKIMRTAKQEWTSFAPVERAANAPLQKRFNYVVKSVQALINVEYQKNSDAKQQVVNSAEKLKEIDDVKAAIDQAKKLQVQWKSCGRTWPREENQLWSSFRAHCDAVFTRKGEEVAAFKAELQEAKVQAESLCEKLEDILLLTGDALLSAKAQLGELSNAFAELGTLPRDSDKAIRGRFFSAKERFEILLKQHRKNQKRVVWENVYVLNQSINQWQARLTEQGKETGDTTALAEKIKEQMQAIEKWPAGTKAHIENKVSAEPISAEALSGNEKALRLLCVRMEIATDMPTPAEDQALRMEHQVSRLQQGMAGTSTSKEDQMAELLLAWLGAGSIAPEVYNVLWARFSEQAL